MAERDYILALSDVDRLRVSFVTNRNGFERFVVQYEIDVDGRWRPVVRYDTAHERPHQDLLRPDGSNKRKTWLDHLPWGEAFVYGREDLLSNWQRYRQDFLRELGHYD